MSKSKYILVNAGVCTECGKLLISLSRHHFDSCACGQFVDGGFDYHRRTTKLKDIPLYWKVGK